MYKRICVGLLFMVVLLSGLIHSEDAGATSMTALPQQTAASPMAVLSRPDGHCNSDKVALGIPAGPVPVPGLFVSDVPTPLWFYFGLPTNAGRGNPAWRMLYVDGGNTIIMYTEDDTLYPDYAIKEQDPHATTFTAHGNTDINVNYIPDYAERMAVCFDRAWERLTDYFQATFDEEALISHVVFDNTLAN